MKDRLLKKDQNAKFDKGFTKETAKARYENLKDEKSSEVSIPRENLIDIKIKKAMSEGEFDNLPGKGKPIDFTGYSALPEHLRIAYQMIKNSGFVPEEVRLKKEMELLKEKIRNCTSADEKPELIKQLTEISRQYHFCMEYNKGFKKIVINLTSDYSFIDIKHVLYNQYHLYEQPRIIRGGATSIFSAIHIHNSFPTPFAANFLFYVASPPCFLHLP